VLLASGWDVDALVREPERAEWLGALGARLCEGDLLSPETEPRLAGMLAGCDAAVHIATSIPADMGAPGAWDLTARLRIEGTRTLTDACLRARVQRYVQQSIVMAYRDGGDEWLDESTPLDTSPERAEICGPVIAMEGILREIAPERLEWCILRGGSFVGPGTMQERIIARLREGTQIVPCDGHNFISPVHVADMALAVAAALERAPAGSTFNIVDEPLREESYLDRLGALVGALTPTRDPLRPCPPSFRCANRAAREALGWIPRYGIWSSIV
jgi:nucleoside-diphosphate-sugar epimerase